MEYTVVDVRDDDVDVDVRAYDDIIMMID